MKDLEQHVRKCRKMLEAIGISCGNIQEVKVNNRYTRKFGSATYNRYTESYVLQFNPGLLNDANPDYSLDSTILHELLHTCKDCMDHGSRWKRYAAMVKKAYGYDIARTSTYEEKRIVPGTMKEREYKYKLECKHCGVVWKYKRMCPTVKHWKWMRCGRCDGKLTLSTLDGEKEA